MCIVVGYLIGSISFSYLFGKMLKGIDIRQHGSGNAGATNTMRVLGVGPAVTVLLLDGLKGVAAVVIARLIAPDMAAPAVLAGIFAIIGHNWPIYFGFRGGKGIATTIGVMATLSFWPALIAGVLAILVIAITRIVSLGSLLFALSLPIAIFAMDVPDAPLIGSAAALVCVFAFVRHRSNIVKLIQGRENKLGSRGKMG